MRGDLVNLNFKAFNKQCSGLIGLKSAIAYFAYTQRIQLKSHPWGGFSHLTHSLNTLGQPKLRAESCSSLHYFPTS